MAAALTLDEFRDLFTVLSPGTVSALELELLGWLPAQLEAETAAVYGKLRKRYAVPFASPPILVKRWVATLVDAVCVVKLGMNPEDSIRVEVDKRHAQTLLDLIDAVEAKEGLTELPLLGDDGPSGVVQPATFFAADTSPFVWQDRQREGGRAEDGSSR